MADDNLEATKEVKEVDASFVTALIFFVALVAGLVICRADEVELLGWIIYGVIVLFLGWIAFFASEDVRVRFTKLLWLWFLFGPNY